MKWNIQKINSKNEINFKNSKKIEIFFEKIQNFEMNSKIQIYKKKIQILKYSKFKIQHQVPFVALFWCLPSSSRLVEETTFSGTRNRANVRTHESSASQSTTRPPRAAQAIRGASCRHTIESMRLDSLASSANGEPRATQRNSLPDHSTTPNSPSSVPKTARTGKLTEFKTLF